MTDPFFDVFGRELKQAAARQVRARRRRQRSLQAFAVAAVIAVAAVAFSSASSDVAYAGVTVQHDGGRITITLHDLETDPHKVEKVLRDEGLNATVQTLPASPSTVGQFVRLIGQELPDTTKHEADKTAFETFSLPERWSGRLVLALGRAARPGESYVRAVNAFTTGEPLACSGVKGLSARQAAARIPNAITVSWQASDQGNTRIVFADQLGTAPWSTYIVDSAAAVGPSRVAIHLSPANTPQPLAPGSLPDARC